MEIDHHLPKVQGAQYIKYCVDMAASNSSTAYVDRHVS